MMALRRVPVAAVRAWSKRQQFQQQQQQHVARGFTVLTQPIVVREEEKEQVSPSSTAQQPWQQRMRATVSKLLPIGSLLAVPTTAVAAAPEAASDAATATATATAAGAAAKASLVGPLMTKFLAIAPPACFLFLQTSPLKTMKSIQQDKSTGQLSPLPFVALAANCVVWVLYGILQSDMTVLVPNASGMGFGLYYTYLFSKYNSGEHNLTPYLAAAGVVTAGVAAAAVTLPPATAATAIGLTGCTLAVLMMSSPLAVIKTIVKEKNTSAMPFAISFATLLNATSWSGYGLLVAQDPMIYAPNLLGFAAACVQMGLFIKYPSKPAQVTASSEAAKEKVEEEKEGETGSKA